MVFGFCLSVGFGGGYDLLFMLIVLCLVYGLLTCCGGLLVSFRWCFRLVVCPK